MNRKAKYYVSGLDAAHEVLVASLKDSDFTKHTTKQITLDMIVAYTEHMAMADLETAMEKTIPDNPYERKNYVPPRNVRTT